ERAGIWPRRRPASALRIGPRSWGDLPTSCPAATGFRAGTNLGEGVKKEVSARGLNPPAKFAPDHCFDKCHSWRIGIEAGEIGEVAAASPSKLSLAADRQLRKCFETVGGKTRGEDGDALPRRAQLREDRVGCRLEPFRAAKARLEGDLDGSAECVGEPAGGATALVVIWVAEFARSLRHTMEARKQNVGLEVERGESGFDRQLQGRDIGRVARIRGQET